VKGRRLSKRARTRCTPEIDAGSARVTNRRKASRTRESTVLQWCGGRSGLDRPDRCVARSSARHRPVDDETSGTSPRLTMRSREHSVRQLDPLAEVGPSPLKRRARRRYRLFAGNAPLAAGRMGARLDNVGCISRPDASGFASRSRSVRKGLRRASQARGEPRHLRLWVSRSEASDEGARNCLPRVDNRAGRIERRSSTSQPPSTTEGASDRRGSSLIGRFTAILGRAGQRRATLVSTSERRPSGRWLWSHWAVPAR